VYLIRFWPGVIYEHRDRRPFTLVEAMRTVEAMREYYGVEEASILREDGSPVVLRAGSASEITHAPSGRTLPRRKVQPHFSSL
jgi:hypothetical protein